MRTHKALDLVVELTRQPEAQTRRNAATALGAIGTAESIAVLVSLALNDQNQAVQERAEEELFLLGSKSDAALHDLVACVHGYVREQSTRKAACALIGRLRNRGVTIALPPLSLWDRISLAAAMRRNGGEQFQYFRPVLFGTLVAAAGVVLWSLLILPNLQVPSLVLLIICGSCAFPQVGLLVTGKFWRWRPISLEVDRLDGMLVDLRLAFIGGLLIGTLMLLLLIWSGGATPFQSRSFVHVPILDSIVLIAAVRLGCLVASASFRRRSLDMAFEAAAGTALGIGALTLMNFLLGAWNDPLASTGLLVLLPISVGLAAAVSRVDHEVTPKGPLFGRLPGIAAGTLVGIVTFSALLAVAPFWSGQQGTPGSVPRTIVIPLTPGSFSHNFDDLAPFPFQVTLRLLGRTIPRIISVGNPASGYRFFRTQSSNAIDFPLWVGALTVTVQSPSDPNLDSGAVLRNAGQRILDRIQRKPGSWDPQDRLELTLHCPYGKQCQQDDGDLENKLCWEGTVRGFANTDQIKYACDQAVKLKQDISSLDSRGLNRLMNSRVPDAITDLSVYLNDAPPSQADQANQLARALWIEGLQQGENPLALFRPTANLDHDAVSLNELCWAGSLAGFARRQEIRDACEGAVKLIPAPNYRDSRGLNHAMNGELQQAKEDFKPFLTDPTKRPDAKVARQRWIADLEKGKNPFTRDELRLLIAQTSSVDALSR